MLVQSNLNNIDIINLWYKIHIEKSIARFPKGTWSGANGKANFEKLFKYIVEEYYHIEINDMLFLNSKWFIKNNLTTPFSKFGKDSPYKAINLVYPNALKKFEMNSACKEYWNKDTAKEALLFYIYKYEITNSDIADLTKAFFKEVGLTTPLNKVFNGSVKNYLEFCFVGREILDEKKKSRNFWTYEKALNTFNSMVKEKSLNRGQIINLRKKWFYENGLSTPLKKFFRNSPYLYIKEAYAKGIDENKFSRVRKPKYYWTKEKAISRFFVLIEEQGIEEKEIINLNAKWFLKNGLKKPIFEFFNNSIIEFKDYILNLK
ncbi:hypothetical protein [uncultured Clostridium sp.]|uniref:hypothetical protein n=1 Tax=uncultured Clostridium sp. TaxID=59620 RepID=UPI002636DF58|nr:hypothetical protein [uncultured Clostridium sp.]